jgi:hypothetical protein
LACMQAAQVGADDDDAHVRAHTPATHTCQHVLYNALYI